MDVGVSREGRVLVLVAVGDAVSTFPASKQLWAIGQCEEAWGLATGCGRKRRDSAISCGRCAAAKRSSRRYVFVCRKPSKAFVRLEHRLPMISWCRKSNVVIIMYQSLQQHAGRGTRYYEYSPCAGKFDASTPATTARGVRNTGKTVASRQAARGSCASSTELAQPCQSGRSNLR